MPRPAPSPRSAVRGFFLLTTTQPTHTTQGCTSCSRCRVLLFGRQHRQPIQQSKLFQLFPLSCLIILMTTQTTRTTNTTKPVVFLSSQDKLLVFFHYLCPCQRPLLVNEGLHPPHVDDENENPRAWFFRPELESECAVTACLLMRKTNSQDWSCRLLSAPSSLLHRPFPLFTNAPR